MRRWLGLAVLVLLQIAYPLVHGPARAALTAATVIVGFAVAVGHAAATRGWRTAATLVAITAGGGYAIEAIGVATGFPFGSYAYTGALGPKLLGVPIVIPLAWTWMAWPAWLAAGHLARGLPRIGIAAVALASWDLFLDPQMVAAGYWRWTNITATLPGVDAVPVTNYLGWLGVAVAMMSVLAVTTPTTVDRHTDAPMLALYVWTYLASVLAQLVFLGLPASGLWGALGMGLVAIPLVIKLVRR